MNPVSFIIQTMSPNLLLHVALGILAGPDYPIG
jgi:hypothetical protein